MCPLAYARGHKRRDRWVQRRLVAPHVSEGTMQSYNLVKYFTPGVVLWKDESHIPSNPVRVGARRRAG